MTPSPPIKMDGAEGHCVSLGTIGTVFQMGQVKNAVFDAFSHKLLVPRGTQFSQKIHAYIIHSTSIMKMPISIT